MNPRRALASACSLLAACTGLAQETPDTSGGSSPAKSLEPYPPIPVDQTDAPQPQFWNWHAQNTDILQYHPGLTARYSGPNSLSSASEVRETVSLDLYAGARLWPGAEARLDGLMWQGFGFSKTLGIEAFPNGEAFRLGTDVPNVNLARVFLRQTIGLGGEREAIEEDALHLKSMRDVSRITVTVGRLSPKDIFDDNAYANDPRTQFMNWALMANEAWDYPADSLGFTSGMAVELNLPGWAMRYGLFQMPRSANGTALDPHFLRAWGMVLEIERRFSFRQRPGVVRLLAYLNQAHMGDYAEAVDNTARPADIESSRAYRAKQGLGLNFEQEIFSDLGVFSRLGWSDGAAEGWTFSDVDRSATLGVSLKGGAWGRANDVVGLAGLLNAASGTHREFLAAGGTGILAGDGRLTYGPEHGLEGYYQFQLWRSLSATLDYQFIANPAFNRDRGPVSVFGTRLHWDF